MSEYTESTAANKIKRKANSYINSYYIATMAQVKERINHRQEKLLLQKSNQALRNDLRNTGKV